MKKTFAVLLSLTMLFALCVPAFAANKTITQDVGTHGDNTGLVQVNGNATGTETYSVSFPADMPIDWKTEKTTFQYDVVTNLKAGNKLNVKVAQSNPVLKNDVSGKTIAYTLAANAANADALNYTTTGATVTATQQYDINIAPEAWNVDLDVYQDTLTFTVEIVTPVQP